MKQLFNGSRIAIEGDNRIYIQGNFLEWYNEDNDCLEGQSCPLVFCNLDLIDIDEDGLWLEQTNGDLLNDNTWYLYETDCTNIKENYLDSEILKKELSEEKTKKVLYLIHTNKILEDGCPMPIWEVFTEKEFDEFEDNLDNARDYWEDTTFTKITSANEFENHPNNFCQADDMIEKIYNYFGSRGVN